MADIRERVTVTEVQIQNLDCKLDDLKAEIRDNRDELNERLNAMQTASTLQHTELANKISNIYSLKDRWMMGTIVVLALILATGGNLDTILKILKALLV